MITKTGVTLSLTAALALTAATYSSNGQLTITNETDSLSVSNAFGMTASERAALQPAQLIDTSPRPFLLTNFTELDEQSISLSQRALPAPPVAEIQSIDGGALAEYAAHKAFVAADPSATDAVQLSVPSQAGPVQMNSHVVGLGFWDTTSGETTLFAWPRESGPSEAEVLSAAEVRITNALQGADADLLYHYSNDRFSQSLVLHSQIPSPQALGVSTETPKLRLVLITEFEIDEAPTRAPAAIDLRERNLALGVAGEDFLPDETLFFGSAMRMTVGKAFLLGETNDVPCGKQFVNVDGHWLLLEFSPWPLVKALIDQLPEGTLHASIKARGNLKKLMASLGVPASLPASSPPKRRQASTAPTSPGTKQSSIQQSHKQPLLTSAPTRKGVVLDYELVSSRLLNIKFGDSTAKTGLAAVGQTTNDYWNVYYYPSSTHQSVTNLLWSDTNGPSVGIVVSNAPNVGTNGSADKMYNTFITDNGATITLTITNLPSNIYNFYLYGHGPRDSANGVFKLFRANLELGYKGTTLWGGGAGLGPSPLTWENTNWTPGIQFQVFTNIAVTNQTIRIDDLGGADGYSYLNGLQIVPTASLPPPQPAVSNVINLNLGDNLPLKVGLAATGLSTNDFWNTYWDEDRNASYSMPHLADANAADTGAGVVIQNAQGAWNTGWPDDMYAGYTYPWDAGNTSLTFTNLPDGDCDVYLYAHTGGEDDNAIFQLWSGDRDYGPLGTGIWGGVPETVTWQESQQYIVFHDVVVQSNQPLTIVVGHSIYGYANCNGLQIVYKGSADTNQNGLPDAWERYYFGNTTNTAAGDPDGDYIPNSREFQLGLDPTRTNTNASERVWLEDALPMGAYEDEAWSDAWWNLDDQESWTWSTNWSGGGWGGGHVLPYSGSSLHVSDYYDGGIHQHWFDKSIVNIHAGTGDVLFAYINLDSSYPPSEIMLQWYVTEADGTGSWEHRAYWGDNTIDWGENTTASRRPVGPVPSPGSWFRLQVPASAVGLEGRVIQGMAFTLYGGRAAWDRAGKLIPDVDGNGIPDWWELQYFSHIGNNPNADPDGDGLSNLQEYQNGTDPTLGDTDYDGMCDGQEIIDATNPTDAESVKPTLLSSFRFDTTNFAGLQGQLPISFTNLALVSGISSNAVSINSNNPAWLTYAEANGCVANINLRQGSARFWLKTTWNSGEANINAANSEPRLLEVGSKGSTNGWWALILNPSGTSLSFCTPTNSTGGFKTNFTVPVNFSSNQWHQLVLGWSPTNACLYLDGQLKTNTASAATNWPNATARAQGWRVGSDASGTNTCRARFDNLQIWNYLLAPAEITADYSAACLGSVDVVFVIDRSASMADPLTGTSNKLGGAKEMATNLLGRLRSSLDQASAVTFWSNTVINQRLTNDLSLVSSAIANITSSNGTRIDLGISNAFNLLTNAGLTHPASIILLSDGENTHDVGNDDWPPIFAIVNLITNSGIRLITFGINATGTGWTDLLRQMAFPSSEFYSITNTSQINSNCASIAYSLCRLTNQPPSVTITNPADYQIFTDPTNIPMGATASDPEDGLVRVDFYGPPPSDSTLPSTNLITSDYYAPFAATWTNFPYGTNLIKAVAVDEFGLTATSSVHIIVNHKPYVTAGPNQTLIWVEGSTNISTNLFGFSSDDGVPYHILTNLWTKFSGPGTVTFSNSVTITNPVATFSTNGTYVLRLSAYDGASTNTSECTIRVLRRPSVTITNPLSNATISLGLPLKISVTATDLDGTIANLSYYTNGSSLASVPVNPPLSALSSSFWWTNAPLGTNVLTVIATDNDSLTRTSSPPVTNIVVAPTCVTAPTNLVHWWKAESNCLDSVGANNGTLAGNATYGSGFVGTGLVLDGTGDAVTLSNTASLQTQTFTIEGWIKRSNSSQVSGTGADAVIFGYGQGGYGLGLDHSTGKLFLSRIGISAVYGNTPITDTVWHHVAVTKTGTTVVFYVDGVANTASAYSVTFTFTTGVAIGARGDNLASAFYGSVDEVSFYSRALATNEIQNIYNASVAGKCPLLSVQLTTPANGQLFVFSPTNILLTATVTNSGGTVTNVNFYTNGVLLASVPVNNPLITTNFLWTNVTWGTYALSAVAKDNLGTSAQSGTNTITVNALPLVSILKPPTNFTAYLEVTNVLLQATNYDRDGTVTNVVFYCETNLPGTASSNNNVWSLTWSNLTDGYYFVTAVATDNRGVSSSSEIRVFTVLPTNPLPAVSITYPTNGATFPAGVNITITAATNGVGSVTNVDFLVNGKLLGSDPDSPYAVTECCWKPGVYVLQAVARDTSGVVALSATNTIVIDTATPVDGAGFWDPAFTLYEYRGYASHLAADGPKLYVGTPSSGGNPNPTEIHYWNGISWLSNVWHNTYGTLGGEWLFALTATSNSIYYLSDNDNALQVIRFDGTNATGVGTNSDLTYWQETLSWAKNSTLKFIGPDLYLVGELTLNTNFNRYCLLRYASATETWEPIGPFFDGPLYAVDSYQGKLVVAGRFSSSGAVSNLHNSAMLINGSWQPLGEGLDGTTSLDLPSRVYSLAACGSKLYAGGDFDVSGYVTGYHGIAVWDGNAWQRMGGGLLDRSPALGYVDWVVCPTVLNLAVRGNTVFAAGCFTGIHGFGGEIVPVSGIARATWLEADQQWLWSDMDLGVYNYSYAPGAFSTLVSGLQIVDGATVGTYDVVASGYITAAGYSMTNRLSDWPPPLNTLARWHVGPSATDAPLVVIQYPTNYSVFTNIPLSLSVTALTASASDVAKVQFYDNGSIFATDTTTPTNTHLGQWDTSELGLHLLKAVAVDTNGLQGESRPVLVSVKDPASPIVARNDLFRVRADSGMLSLPVLTNDTGTNIHISQLVQIGGALGRAEVAFDRRSITYTPFAHVYGTERFGYTITNSGGAADSAWVTVDILASPSGQITSPHDETRFVTNASVSIITKARDYDGSITNVSLVLNGLFTVGQTADLTHTFTWSTNVPGFYTFTVVARDNDGLTNQPTPVTIVITNGAASPHGPLAQVSNLAQTGGSLSDPLSSASPPVIREGLFDLQGTASDQDGDSVSYAVLLYRPEDLDPGISDDLYTVITATTPFANLTPAPLNPQSFKNGAVTNASLGTLDLTRFPNGIYYLALRVRGGTDETNAIVRFQLDSNLKIGQFSFSEQDLVLPVNGIPLTVTRTYNSLNPRAADFGYSWTYALNSMDVQLNDERQNVTIGTSEAPFADDEEDDNGLPKVVNMRIGGGWDVTLTMPDGRRTTFAFDYTGTWPQLHARWISPPDVHATLKMLGNNDINFGVGGFTVPTWADSDLTHGRAPLENQDIRGWSLTNQDGTTYIIERPQPGASDTQPINLVWDPSGNGSSNFVSVRAYGPPKLTKIVQRTGDWIEINNNGVFHHNPTNAITRSVFLTRDQQGRIIELRDPISSSNGLALVKYVYNRDTGNLIQVLKLTDRAAGTYVTNKYHYDNPNFPHYLTSIDNPLGVPVARNEYDETGRLTAVIDAEGNRTEFHHNDNPTNRVEVVIDRLGRTNSHAYDERGNVTASTNALGEFTLMTYDTTNNLRSITDALNHATMYDYDERGNRTMVINALNHTNIATYNALGNVTGTKDPLGNWTTNLYDEFGNLTNTVQRDSNNVIIAQSSSRYDGGLLVQTLDANGNTNATFTYDGSGNVATSIDAKRFTNSFNYDPSGNQTNTSYTWTGPNGSVTVTTRIEYDAQGRVVRTFDALGNTNQTFYNALGKVDYTIDQRGNTNSFLYDAPGNVIQTIGPDGLVTRTVFNADGKPIYTADCNGITGTRTDYDAAGRVTNTIRLTNVSITISPVSDGIWTTITNSAGTPYSTNSTEYYANGWVKSRTGPDRKTTSYTYYDDGQTATVTDALTNVTTYAYDDAGRQQYVADALNRTNRSVYDGAGRNVKTIFADNSYVTNIFNVLGQRTGVNDQAGLLTQFAYDVSGQLTNVVKSGVVDPEDSYHTNFPSWGYKYDQYGRQTEMVDPKLRSTTNSYDAYGREVSRWLPMGGAGDTNFYNALGQLTNHTDFKGQRTLFAYDRLGRVKAKFFYVDPTTPYPSNTICYLYNQLGQLTNITERFGVDASTNDCGGMAALFRLPGGGRGLHAVSFPARVFAALNQVSADVWGGSAALGVFALAAACIPRDRRQQLALFVGELIRAHWQVPASPDANAGLFSLLRLAQPASTRRRFRLPSVFWRFATVVTLICLIGSDPRFEPLWTANAACIAPADTGSTFTTRITNFAYDFEGRVTQVNSPEGYINYEYDAATGRHTRTCTANSEFTYQYDALGRLWKVNVLKRNGSTVSETTTYEYTEVGSRKCVELPSGIGGNTSYAYDSLNRLTGLTNRASDNSVLSQFNYQVDATGRRTNAVEILRNPDDATFITNTITCQYDGMYRLTNEVQTSTSGTTALTHSTRYEYDKCGNRWKKVDVVGGNTTTVTNRYNANDQLEKEVTLNGSGTPTATNTYAYDANGSVIARTNISVSGTTMVLYGNDLKNKLSSVATYNGSWTTNYFQYNDQGIRVRTISGGSTKYFLVDANNHTGYAQVLEELDTVGGTPSRSYVVGDDVMAQCGTTASDPAYLLYDGHGNTRQTVHSIDNVTEQYNYDAYGVSLTTLSNPETSMLYCGEQFDSALAMYNLRARYYNPATGTFNQRDTYAGNNLDPQSLHKYTYGNCDPTNGVDPSGHEFNYMTALTALYIWYTLSHLSIIRPFGEPSYGEESPSNASAPGFWESLIPVWGNAKLAQYHLEAGNYWRAAAFGALAVTDVFLVRSLVVGLAKGATQLAGKVSAGRLIGDAVISSGENAAGKIADMVVLREIQHGEKLADITHELKVLTYTTGKEHAVLKMENGARVIVSGGEGGIRLSESVVRLFVHTHPYEVPAAGVASTRDLATIARLQQVSSWILEHGNLFKFTVP